MLLPCTGAVNAPGAFLCGRVPKMAGVIRCAVTARRTFLLDATADDVTAFL